VRKNRIQDSGFRNHKSRFQVSGAKPGVRIQESEFRKQKSSGQAIGQC
jgi:hypothetical protein